MSVTAYLPRKTHPLACVYSRWSSTGSLGDSPSFSTYSLQRAQSEVIRAILMLGERIASQPEVIGAILMLGERSAHNPG